MSDIIWCIYRSWKLPIYNIWIFKSWIKTIVSPKIQCVVIGDVFDFHDFFDFILKCLFHVISICGQIRTFAEKTNGVDRLNSWTSINWMFLTVTMATSLITATIFFRVSKAYTAVALDRRTNTRVYFNSEYVQYSLLFWYKYFWMLRREHETAGLPKIILPKQKRLALMHHKNI